MQKIREIVLFEDITKLLSIVESLQVARAELFVVVPLALVQNGIWWEFTSGTIPNTDTIEVCLVVAAAKLTLKMQRMH